MDYSEQFACLSPDEQLMLFLVVADALPIENENVRVANGDFELEDTDGIQEFLRDNDYPGDIDEYISGAFDSLIETKFAFSTEDKKIAVKKDIVEYIVFGEKFPKEMEVLQKTIFDEYTKAEFGIMMKKDAASMKKLIAALEDDIESKEDLLEFAQDFEADEEIIKLLK